MSAATGRSMRFFAAALGCVAVVALAACGGSNDSDEADTSGKSEVQQARAAIDAMYDGYRDSDPEAVCAVLSDEAKQQIARGELGEKGDCADSIEELLAQAEKVGGLKRTLSAKVLRVKVNGDRATAKMRFGAQRGDMRLVKVDGEWKIDASQ